MGKTREQRSKKNLGRERDKKEPRVPDLVYLLV
jgi:hypothetical protein